MSEQARAYRLLQHWLLAHADPRVIAVTSARPGEGKTTCATNLALAFADETRAKVLLIDANLRRPAMSALFRFEPEESFIGRMVEYRDATPPYSVAGIRGTRLQVAALPPKVAPGQRLDRVLFGNAIRRLRGAFDYIVIDTASVLESADADVVSEASSPATVLGTVLIDA
jgi:Mrp family chromosome partitioning ATPase